MKDSLEYKSEFLKEFGNELFTKFDEKTLKKEMRDYKNGKIKTISKNLIHFFKEVRYTALYKLNPNKYDSPFDIVNDDEKINIVLKKIDDISKKTVLEKGLDDFLEMIIQDKKSINI